MTLLVRFALALLRLTPLAVLVAASTSCGESFGLQDILGTYTATTFTVTPAGQSTIDVLAAGGSLTLTLAGDGSTTGQLAVPASLNQGTPLNASMAGTFTLDGTTVTFDQAADTFVRDMDFSASGNVLQGSASFGGDAVAVTLVRP